MYYMNMNGFKPSVLMRGLDNSAMKPNGPDKAIAVIKPNAAISSSVAKPIKSAPKAETAETKAETPSSEEVNTEEAGSDQKKPQIKKAVAEFLKKQKSPVKSADIYEYICSKYGEYKKQALYMALKDEKQFIKTIEGKDALFSLNKVKK